MIVYCMGCGTTSSDQETPLPLCPVCCTKPKWTNYVAKLADAGWGRSDDRFVQAKNYLKTRMHIHLRAQYILNMCRGEEEMRAEATAILRLLDGMEKSTK